MKYVVESFYDDAKVTVETDDPEVAVLEMMERDMAGVHAHVMDGYTGEVLAIVNHPSQFSTPEFALMTLGVLMVHQGEEDEEEPAPANDEVTDIPALLAKVFGVPVETVLSLPEGLPS